MKQSAALTNEAELLRQDCIGVAHLTLNRPRQYNALSESLIGKLHAELDRLAEDETVRVVVLGGAGKVFCAGHDLKEMRANPDQEYYENLFRACSAMMVRISTLPKPVIARVHGLATAAGCQLVAACDLAVAASDTRFAVSGVNIGLFCSTPSVALSRNLSRKHAFEMLVTGEFIAASAAVEKGLINRAVPTETLDAAIAELSASICRKPAVAVETGKRMFYRQLEHDLVSAYDYAARIMASNMMAADTSEGIDAFIEKREPDWKLR